MCGETQNQSQRERQKQRERERDRDPPPPQPEQAPSSPPPSSPPNQPLPGGAAAAESGAVLRAVTRSRQCPSHPEPQKPTSVSYTLTQTRSGPLRGAMRAPERWTRAGTSPLQPTFECRVCPRPASRHGSRDGTSLRLSSLTCRVQRGWMQRLMETRPPAPGRG